REGDPVQAGRDVERGDDERRRERRGAEVNEIARAAEVPALPVDAERRVAADLDRGRERGERDRLLGLGYLDAAADPKGDGNEVRDGDSDEIEPGEPRDRHRTYSAARSASGRSRSQATVRSRPSRSETRGAQPSSSRASVGSAMSRSTSLDAGRTRVWSSSMRRGTSAISAMSEARSPMAISTPVPSCTVRPTTCGMVPARTKPATVSLTNVKSRVGDREPRRTGPPRISCAAIVGMTARSDCRGPYVLKGRTTTTGVPNDAWYASARWSAAALEAAYGDCGRIGCSSVIGTCCAVPYTSLVEVCTTCCTSAFRLASSTF